MAFSLGVEGKSYNGVLPPRPQTAAGHRRTPVGANPLGPADRPRRRPRRATSLRERRKRGNAATPLGAAVTRTRLSPAVHPRTNAGCGGLWAHRQQIRGTAPRCVDFTQRKRRTAAPVGS